MNPSTARPAHRPSRRTQIIDSAMTLFARLPLDDVTVGDIAEAAEMTPAAVYYHFAGKEHILLEGTRSFTDALVERAHQGVEAQLAVGDLVAALLDHIRKRRTVASVFFVNAAGLNVALEAHRKVVRCELGDLFNESARQARGELSAAESGVIGAALVSLLEVSTVSALSKDATFRGLGARRFPFAVIALANRIVGLDQAC